jgi:hypothetical protein
MKSHVKLTLVSGYVFVSGVLLVATGYIPLETIGAMLCGAAIALSVRSVEMFNHSETEK